MEPSKEELKNRKAERINRLREHRKKEDAEDAERRRKFLESTNQQISERQRKYFDSKQAQARERHRKWCDANLEFCAWRTHANRAWRGGKSSLEIIGLSREMTKTVWSEKRKIARKYFRRGELHHDHMTPLSLGETDKDRRDLNYFTNFVFIPAKANLSKHAKPFWSWFATLTDQNLVKCIAEQDAYNKRIQREIYQPTKE